MANTASSYYPYITEPAFTYASIESAYNRHNEVINSFRSIARPSSVIMKINDIETNIMVDYIENGLLSDIITFEIRPPQADVHSIIIALINDDITITLGDSIYAGQILDYDMKFTEIEGHVIHLRMAIKRKQEIEHRYCFKCNSLITFGEFHGANRFKHPYGIIKRLWNDDRVELLCCGCYKKPDFKLREGIPRCSICNEPIGGMGFFGLCYNCNSKKVDTSCDRQLELGGIVIEDRRPTQFEIGSNRQKELQVIHTWGGRPTQFAEVVEEPAWMTIIKNIKKECEKLIKEEKT